MEQFTYENQGINTYLVCELSNEDIDTMSLGMLTNNRIPGFAPAIYTQLNESKYIKYNISAKISMEQFFMGMVGRARLLKVFHGIACALMAAEDYMIDTRAVILEAGHIFVNVSTCETEVICVPVLVEQDVQVDYGKFFKNIMFSTQFDKNENCNYVAVLINYLNSTPVFSIMDFRKILEELLTEEVKEQPKQQSQPVVREQQTVPQSDIVFTTSHYNHTNNEGITSEKQSPEWNKGMEQQVKANQSDKGIQPAFEVPGGKSIQLDKKDEGEEKMSLFYLLQHYSKENAAIYNAQKNAEKAAKDKIIKEKSKKPDKKTENTSTSSKGASYSFVVPGASNERVAQQKSETGGQQNNADFIGQKNIQNRNEQVQNVVDNYQHIEHKRANFGETTDLSTYNKGKGNTTVLKQEMLSASKKPYLIRVQNREQILLDKPIFRIGKEKSYVDYFVSDNTAVSRSHANIITRDSKYYVEDTNSTNHTFVNGEMIPSNYEKEIFDGAKIMLGNEEFEFKLL